MSESVLDGDHAGGEVALNPSLRFDAVPYKPDGGCPPLGALLTFLFAAGGAVLLGTLASFVGQWFYLVFLFPIGLGLGLGTIAGIGIDKGKVRSRSCGIMAASFAACLLALSMHYADYQRSLGAVKELEADLQAQLQAQVKVREFSFAEYINDTATQGVTLTGSHGGGGINLGYYGTFIYWIFEIGLIGFMTGLMLRMQIKRPFCTFCETWKKERKLGNSAMPQAVLLHAVTTGEVGGLASEKQLQSPDGPLELTAYACTHCEDRAQVEIKLTEMTTNSKGQKVPNELAFVSYPGEALQVFEALFAPVPLWLIPENKAPIPEPREEGAPSSS